MRVEDSSVSRRVFLRNAGAIGAATVGAAALSACSPPPAPAAAPGATAAPAAAANSQPTVQPQQAAAASTSGTKHTLVWVTQALGEWQAPMLTGYRDFLDMSGWDFVGLGDARYSVENHIREVTNAIQRKPDVLVTSLENAQAIGPLLLDARKQGIKVMVADQTNFGWGRENDVASHSEDSPRWGQAMGYEAAKQAHKTLNKTDGVFIVGNGNPGAALIEARIKGAQDGVAKYNQDNNTKFTTDVFADSAFDDLTQSVGKYTAKYDSVKDSIVGTVGIAGPNNTAFSKMMKDKGLKPGSLISGGGFDDQSQIDAMQDGYIQFMFVRNTYGMGYIAASQAWQWVERGFKPSDYMVSFDLTYPPDLQNLKSRDAIWVGKAKSYGFMK